MDEFYLGHWLTNLIIPDEPDRLTIRTPAGLWELNKSPSYSETKLAISNNGQCGETYSISIGETYTGSRTDAIDAASDELIPICLGASYLTGLSVAPNRSLPSSQVSFMQVGTHFPRPRAMGEGFPTSSNTAEFVQDLEAFVAAYPNQGVTEKIRLVSHHFLDALAFWSIEDLVLSAATILEIIAATSKTIAGSGGTAINTFNARMAFAATRFNLRSLPSDFRRMRNDLVHEGVLSGRSFPNKDAMACGIAVAETLDWIDHYIYAAMGMGRPRTARFIAEGFRGANSFSL